MLKIIKVMSKDQYRTQATVEINASSNLEVNYNRPNYNGKQMYDAGKYIRMY